MIEYLVHIPTICVGEILQTSNKRWPSDQEEKEFEELMMLYTTNANTLREFAKNLINQVLFQSAPIDKQYLRIEDFIVKMT